MANEIGLKIGETESSLLIQTVGSSLRDIASQLEKLKLTSFTFNHYIIIHQSCQLNVAYNLLST